MNEPRSIERLLDDWLGGGPTELPDRVLDNAMDLIDRTAQRRPLGMRWRASPMTDSFKILVTALTALALVVGGGVLARVSGPPTGASGVAATPAAATATPAPTIAVATFTSKLFRYRVDYPASWAVRDPLADIVSFSLPTIGTLVEVEAAPTSRIGGLYWPWGGITAITGADLETLHAAAVADLDRQGLRVLRDGPAPLGGKPAWRIEVDALDIGEGPLPLTIVLAHRGDLYQAIFLYGPHGAPEFEAFLSSFAYTD